MPERRIAIIDPFHPRIVETIRAALHPGWALVLTEAPEEAARARALAQADAAFLMATPMPASLLAAALELRFIQKLGAGVDRIGSMRRPGRGAGTRRRCAARTASCTARRWASSASAPSAASSRG